MERMTEMPPDCGVATTGEYLSASRGAESLKTLSTGTAVESAAWIRQGSIRPEPMPVHETSRSR